MRKVFKILEDLPYDVGIHSKGSIFQFSSEKKSYQKLMRLYMK